VGQRADLEDTSEPVCRCSCRDSLVSKRDESISWGIGRDRCPPGPPDHRHSVCTQERHSIESWHGWGDPPHTQSRALGLMKLLPCLLACGWFAFVLSILEIKAVDYLYIVDRWQLAILIQVVDLLLQTRARPSKQKASLDGNHTLRPHALDGSKNFSTCSGTADHNWHVLRAVS